MKKLLLLVLFTLSCSSYAQVYGNIRVERDTDSDATIVTTIVTMADKSNMSAECTNRQARIVEENITQMALVQGTDMVIFQYSDKPSKVLTKWACTVQSVK